MIVWNSHAHVDETTALAHIEELGSLMPPVGIESKYMHARPAPLAETVLDLDTPDELAVRALILGIVHRTIGDYVAARALLNDALKHGANVEISTWVCAVVYFELAVLEMKEGDRKAAERVAGKVEKKASSGNEVVAMKEAAVQEVKVEVEEEKGILEWRNTFRVAREMLAEASALCTREMDLSSRLDSRIMMLKEEIQKKMVMVGCEG